MKTFIDFGIDTSNRSDVEIKTVCPQCSSARKKTLEQRFEENTIRTESGCQEWAGAKTDKGYGLIEVEGKTRRAHRVSFEYFKGAIPAGMLILHRCDNPSCVNPEHLRAGTQTDNMQEMVAKGRQRIVVTDARKGPKAAYETNTSGHVGVYAIRGGARWGAKLGNRYLGSFETFEDAVACRAQAEAA
jgi:hypothetical protein